MQDAFQKSKILYAGNSGSLPRRPRRFSFRRFLYAGICLVFLCVLGALYYMLQLPLLRFSDVHVAGLQTLSSEEVMGAVRADLAGTYFFLIPRDSYFFVSGAYLEERLKKQFSRIAEVAVKKTTGQPLSVTITERSVWGIVCEKANSVGGSQEVLPVQEKKTDACFYIDRSGTAFEDVSSFAGSLFPVIYKEEPGMLGQIAVAPADVEFFESSRDFLHLASGLSLFSMESQKTSPNDMHLYLKEGWELIVPRDKSPEEWTHVLDVLLSGEIKDRKKDLLYVDLRFGNKVFYKFR